MGVSEEWIEKAETADSERHQLFMVVRVDADHGDGLNKGDVLLTLNGKLITLLPDLDIMYNNEFLDAVVVRKRKEKTIKVSTIAAEDLETGRVVRFCGATFHRPHQAVRQQISKVHSDVYISSRAHGSPAEMYGDGLPPTNFITHVNNVATLDLSAFLIEINKIKGGTFFRLKAVTFDKVPWVVTMKKDEHYFPTTEYIRDVSAPLGWKKIMHERDAGDATEGIRLDQVRVDAGIE